jgi:hypothetical protein
LTIDKRVHIVNIIAVPLFMAATLCTGSQTGAASDTVFKFKI